MTNKYLSLLCNLRYWDIICGNNVTSSADTNTVESKRFFSVEPSDGAGDSKQSDRDNTSLSVSAEQPLGPAGRSHDLWVVRISRGGSELKEPTCWRLLCLSSHILLQVPAAEVGCLLGDQVLLRRRPSESGPSAGHVGRYEPAPTCSQSCQSAVNQPSISRQWAVNQLQPAVDSNGKQMCDCRVHIRTRLAQVVSQMRRLKPRTPERRR